MCVCVCVVSVCVCMCVWTHTQTHTQTHTHIHTPHPGHFQHHTVNTRVEADIKQLYQVYCKVSATVSSALPYPRTNNVTNTIYRQPCPLLTEVSERCHSSLSPFYRNTPPNTNTPRALSLSLSLILSLSHTHTHTHRSVSELT